MDEDTLTYGSIWSELSSTLGSDAAGGRGVLPGNIRPLSPGQRLIGRAEVLQVIQTDNGSIRALLESTEPRRGTVLVVAGAAGSATSVIGGITSRELHAAGFAGLVTDGPVRDAAEIRAGNLLVWCDGLTPTASTKNWRQRPPERIVIGGVPVCSGDVVLADDDGIVVWPAANLSGLLSKAQEKFDADTERLARLKVSWSSTTAP
jgi:4-hydroxy-4-methyl-2-oxoglutarate aldolase